MHKTGEIDQVIRLFESSARQLPYTGGSLERASRDQWKGRMFYNHGAVNAQFLTFLAGYSAGKAAAGAGGGP